MLKCEKVFKYFFHDCLKVFLSNLSSLTTHGSLKNDEFFVEKKKTKQKELYINTALPSTGTSLISNLYHCVKSVQKYRVISGPYFPIFGLNAEIFHANLCIQSEYRKIRTRNNSVFGHFSHCVLEAEVQNKVSCKISNLDICGNSPALDMNFKSK